MRHLVRPLVLSVAVVVLALCGSAWSAETSSARPTELSSALGTLEQVRLEGLDDTAARQAWRIVAAADAGQLTAVLAALDRAGPLAANWIRSAADAIAARSLPRGSPELNKSLEIFVLDTAHSPRARRMAYEWLVRFDPPIADRLVPGFLNDPSTELRRDAVDRLIGQADKLMDAGRQGDGKFEPGKQAEALAIYRQAMTAARDLDQVNQLVKLLEKLGDHVDLPKHFGFITTWQLIGPFDNTGGKGLEAIYPPETAIDLAASYQGKTKSVAWFSNTTKDPFGMVDLNQAIDKVHGAVAYATAEFYADRERPVEVRLGCITACKLWLNGQYLIGQQAYHAGTKIDQFIGHGVVRPGRNVILLKICQNEQTEAWAQNWQFQLRLCDSLGAAVPFEVITGKKEGKVQP